MAGNVVAITVKIHKPATLAYDQVSTLSALFVNAVTNRIVTYTEHFSVRIARNARIPT